MATHELFIPAEAFTPDNSGNVFKKPTSIDDVSDLFEDEVCAFKDSGTKIHAFFKFLVPQNYAGTAKFFVMWKSTVTSNDVEWDLAYRAMADAEDLDPSTYQQDLNNAGTPPGTARQREDTEITTVTAGNFAAGDLVKVRLSRDGADAGDGHAAEALVEGVIFQYSDT